MKSKWLLGGGVLLFLCALLAWGQYTSADKRQGLALSHLQKAQQLYRHRHVSAARLQALAAIEILPDLSQAYLLLARFAYTENNPLESLFLLDIALACEDAQPVKEELLTFQERIKRETLLEATFLQHTHSHFVVKWQREIPDSYVVEVFTYLDEAYGLLTRRLHLFPVRPIQVIVYSPGQYQQLLSEFASGLRWSKAFFDGKIRLPLLPISIESMAIRETLHHEMSHAILHQAILQDLPTWFEEGLAQLVSDQEISPTHAPLTWIPLQDLRGSWAHFPRERAEMAYRQSGQILQFLESIAGWEGLQQLLNRLQRGEMFDAVVADTFDLPMTEIEEIVRFKNP